MKQELKKIRTPLIIASITTVLALIYFGYQQYRISLQLDKFSKLTVADNAFFSGNFEKAFELYNEIDSDFFSDSLKEMRKRMYENSSHSEENYEYLDEKSKNDLIELIANCKPEKTAETLSSLSHKELISLLKQCYKNTKTEKLSYKNKATESKTRSYLRINGNKVIHYFGETKDSLAHGYGVGVWEDQRFYEGEWKNNLRHGKGIFTTEKGEVYDGEYVEGQRNGKGTYTFRNGDFYTGDWKDGGRSGFGTVIDSKGDTIVHGFWENDSFDRRRTRKELN